MSTAQVCHRAETCTDALLYPTAHGVHGAQPASEEHLDLDKVRNHNQDGT